MADDNNDEVTGLAGVEFIDLTSWEVWPYSERNDGKDSTQVHVVFNIGDSPVPRTVYCPIQISARLRRVSKGARKAWARSMGERKETQMTDAITLTDLQNKVLRKFVQGYSYLEIAEALNISPVSVQSVRSAIVEKFAAVNITNAVAKAVKLGLVDV